MHKIYDELHAEKYRAPGEDFREAMSRIASVLKSNDEHFHEIREILLDQRFLPGGRIQASIGSVKTTTAYNCFVSGKIADSFVDGEGNIMDIAKQAAETMRQGGGIGYDFSTLRPRGARIKKLDSSSSGPVSFMEIFNSVCLCVASAGHRKGAQMGILRIDHPDIVEFIHAKQNISKLLGFNLSVAVTDEFMVAVESDADFILRFDGAQYATVNAKALWEILMRSTYDWAEPGVIFIDQVNRMNNLQHIEEIAASNPCAEQPLPPHGCCLLGSFNLTQYLNLETKQFNWNQFKVDIPPIVEMMDNIIEIAAYPLEEQKKEAQDKRRMGLGITGLANTAEILGYPYGSGAFIGFMTAILKQLQFSAYQKSIDLAKTKGAYPRCTKQIFGYLKTLPDVMQDEIREFGIRNSHLLSIAPTGTISLTAGNVSSGIEPVFAHFTVRGDLDGEAKLRDWALAHANVYCKTTAEVTVDEHLKVLACATSFVDSAVSKTCNVPIDIDWEDFKDIYMKAWKMKCKGLATFRLGGKREGILKGDSQCEIDLKTGKRDCE